MAKVLACMILTESRSSHLCLHRVPSVVEDNPSLVSGCLDTAVVCYTFGSGFSILQPTKEDES